jgi:hypothetical protein
LNKISPNFLEKLAKNTKTSTPKINLKAQNIQIKRLLKPSKTNHGLKLLLWVEIGWVKSSLNSEISANLVTLTGSVALFFFSEQISEKVG